MEAEVQEPVIVFKGDVPDNYGQEVDYNIADPAEAAAETPAEAPATEAVTEVETPKEQPAAEETVVTEQPIAETPAETQAAYEPPAEVAAADPYEMLGLKEQERTLIEGAVKALKAGDLDNFLRVRSTDWSKVDDFEIMRQEAEKKYKDLDQEDRDFMIANDLSKYDTENFDDIEARKAKIQLKLDAKPVRDARIAEQEQYKIPERPAEPPEVAAQRAQDLKAADDYSKAIFADPALAEFETNKTVKIGDGDDAFNYVADKVNIKSILKDGSMGDYLIDGPKGTPPKFNMPKFIEDSVWLKSKADISKKLIEHGKMLGRREYDAELRNPGKRSASAAPEPTNGVKWIGDIKE